MMKQKRTFVTLVLVVALLCLGIVYAVIDADTLTINGTAEATVADGKVDVVFTKATVADDSNPDTEAKITNATDDTASFTVAGLTTVGDKQTVIFDIENQTENGVPVTLQTPTVVCSNEKWYRVTTKYGNANLAAHDLAGDTDSTTLTVTVELLKTVSTEASKTEANNDNTVTITLDAVAANN